MLVWVEMVNHMVDLEENKGERMKADRMSELTKDIARYVGGKLNDY